MPCLAVPSRVAACDYRIKEPTAARTLRRKRTKKEKSV